MVEQLEFSSEFLAGVSERELPPVSEEEKEWQARFYSNEGDFFRNRLAGMMGFVEIASSEVNNEALRKSLRQYEDFKTHYIKREEKLVTFQRGACERLPQGPEFIWREVELILGPELLKEVGCEIGEPETKFSLDQRQMGWAVAELVRNAFEAVGRKRFSGKEKGRVKVVFAVKEEGLEVSVADNGEGIDEEVSNALSSPQIRKFRKHRFEGKVFAGPGFGLPIARAAVENHGGKITFKTRKGEGSLFTITLPRSDNLGEETIQ